MNHRWNTRGARAAAAVAGLTMLATACGGGGGSARSADADRDAQTEDCPGLTKAVDKSENFTWMYSVDNSSFDPDGITTNNSLMYLNPIYDNLVHVNEKGEPEPMLAESWKLNDDGTELTMKLIEDWKYHDGAPFDADYVVANIKRSQKPGSFNVNPLRIVTDVAAIDDRTVRFTTKGGAGALIGVLGGAAGMMMSPRVFDDPNQDVKPTGGSGAFTMKRYVSGSRVEYAAVKDYWDPEAVNVSGMTYLVSGDDNARLNAVSTGAADSTFLRASMYQPAKDAGLVVCEQPSLSAYTMNLNTDRSEFGSPDVRAALNQAIDRKAISSVTDGFLKPGGQMFPTWYYAANDKVDPKSYAYDPKHAKELLAKAGLQNGFAFDLEVVNLDLYQQIAEVIQANLSAVGIKMSITPVELDALGEHFSVNKDVDAILFEQKAEADPSILTAAYYLPNGFNNPGGWGSPEVSKLEEAAKDGATAEERAPLYNDFFAAVQEEVPPNIVLGHLTTPFVMNDKTKGVEIYVDGARQFRGVGMEPGGN
jgi:ABC-type transport system substrate-binding protein